MRPRRRETAKRMIHGRARFGRAAPTKLSNCCTSMSHARPGANTANGSLGHHLYGQMLRTYATTCERFQAHTPYVACHAHRNVSPSCHKSHSCMLTGRNAPACHMSPACRRMSRSTCHGHAGVRFPLPPMALQKKHVAPKMRQRRRSMWRLNEYVNNRRRHKHVHELVWQTKGI